MTMERQKLYLMYRQIIDKDPAVILDDDSVSSYVALKVQYFNEDGEEITFGEFQETYLDGNSQSQGLDFSDSWVYRQVRKYGA